MTTRITEALGRTMTKSQSKYNENAKFPILQAYRPLLTGWLDSYIRHRLFGQEFGEPLGEENWRVLLLDDVAHSIAGTFATKLVELQDSQVVAYAEVQHRSLSEVTTIPVRGSTAEEVDKCIYPKLPIPSHGGGLRATLHPLGRQGLGHRSPGQGARVSARFSSSAVPESRWHAGAVLARLPHPHTVHHLRRRDQSTIGAQ